MMRLGRPGQLLAVTSSLDDWNRYWEWVTLKGEKSEVVGRTGEKEQTGRRQRRNRAESEEGTRHYWVIGWGTSLKVEKGKQSKQGGKEKERGTCGEDWKGKQGRETKGEKKQKNPEGQT